MDSFELLRQEIRALREDLSRYDAKRSSPRGVVRNPVTVSIVGTLPAAGGPALVIDNLYKVQDGFTFYSTYLGVMIDTEQSGCPLAAGGEPVENKAKLLADLATTANTGVPAVNIEVKLSGSVQKNFRINATSWTYGSPDPAEFVTQAFQNDVYSMVITNNTFTYGGFVAAFGAKLNNRIIVRLDGWLEAIDVKERFK
jgi:hypothetical protein